MNTPEPTAVIETDAVIVGAGPAGIFQAFQLGLLEAQAHIIEALPYAGGQCVELYGDKPIYDIPGIEVCTGRELTEKLLRQVAPFKPQFHFNQLVSRIAQQPDGRWQVQTSTQQVFLAKALFIAAGVGAFQPRALKVEGLDQLAAQQVHYRVPAGIDLAGSKVLIVGDTEDALQTAVALGASVRGSGRVTLMHRRDVFVAEDATVQAFRASVAAGAIDFVAGQLSGLDVQAGRMQGCMVLGSDGNLQSIPADHVIALQGLSPKLGPIADWGLALERRQLVVDPETYATSAPGIFAIGDINTYPGKKKLILCSFHECVLAAFAAMRFIFPDKKVLLQYTTTSTKLHALLGV